MRELRESAREQDRDDELRAFRDSFWIPVSGSTGAQQVYLCGHSLGLQARTAEAAVQTELRRWRELAVDGHFRGQPPWIDYADELADALAALVGARPGEVAVMNSLTVNLHLMMVSFYRPHGPRRKILIEQGAFPSDRYAVESQIRFHGFDPADCLLELEPAAGSRIIDESAIESILSEHGAEIALVLWPGVQYASGQSFDLDRISAAAHAAGCLVGFDLAHSVGNVPLELHDSSCDFAVWCTYKYLNGGPGAIAACFVHERHAADNSLPRFEGWWGNAREGRFRMEPDFCPAPGAEAWQVSNPPILAMAPLRASLALFREAGIDRLRAKSVSMTNWLWHGIEQQLADVLEVLSPEDPARRGCQLSLRVRAGREQGRQLFTVLSENGVVADWREPDILRVAPVPLYNRFADCYEFLRQVAVWAGSGGMGH